MNKKQISKNLHESRHDKHKFLDTVIEEKTIDYNDMMRIGTELGLWHSDIFCGHGRQPIYYRNGIVECNCILSGERCYRKPYDGAWKDQCDTYRKQLLEWNK